MKTRISFGFSILLATVVVIPAALSELAPVTKIRGPVPATGIPALHRRPIKVVRTVVPVAPVAPGNPVVVGDTVAVYPGCKGPGCLALERTRDSVHVGGDGIADNGDDWEVKVWRITVCSQVGDDLDAPGTVNATFDSLNLSAYQSGYYNVVLLQTDGACEADLYENDRMNNVYFAGQTVRNEEGTSWFGATWRVENPNTADVMFRYLRNRGLANQGIAMHEGKRLLFDHISSSWVANGGGQANIKLGGADFDTIRHGSVNWSLVFEPRKNNPTNLTIGNGPRDAPGASKVGFIRNTILGHGHRCPNLSADTMLVTKTIAYNCSARWGVMGPQFQATIYGYAVWAGDGSRGAGGNFDRPMAVNHGCGEPLSGTVGPPFGDDVCENEMYVNNWTYIYDKSGDTIWNETNPDLIWRGPDSLIVCRQAGPQDGTMLPDWSCPAQGDTVAISNKKASPHTPTDFDIPDYFWPDTTGYADTTQIIAQLDSAGAAFRLTCAGRFVPARDMVDTIMVNNFLRDIRGTTPVGHGVSDTVGAFHLTYSIGSFGGVSIADDLADTVTLQVSLSGTHKYVGPDTSLALPDCLDTDDDGMPDIWESTNRLDLNDASDNAEDPDGDWYLNIEEYLNGTNPQVYTSAVDGFEDGPPSTIPAFPGAVGYGATSLNSCRDSVSLGSYEVKVWKVSSLHGFEANGSWYTVLKDSLQAGAYNIVIADSVGLIETTGGMGPTVGIQVNCVYVAMQAGPGFPMIQLNDSTIGSKQLQIGNGSTNNLEVAQIVVRYMQWWRDTCTGGGSPPSCANHSNIDLVADTLILDHITIHNGWDSNIAVSAVRSNSITAITISSALFSNVTGAQTNCESSVHFSGESVSWISYVSNLMMLRHRIPCNGGTSDVDTDSSFAIAAINNVIFAWPGRGATWSHGPHGQVDYRRNFYKPFAGRSDVDDIIKFFVAMEDNIDTTNWSIRQIANVMAGQLDSISDPDWWADWNYWTSEAKLAGDTMGHVADSDLPTPFFDYLETTAWDAEDKILGNRRVGQDSVLSCGGTWVLAQGYFDSLYINAARDSSMTLISNSAPNIPHRIKEHPDGDWPRGKVTYAAGCTDTDDDGFPDDYENNLTGSTTSWGPIDSIGASGALLFESYVNGVHPDSNYVSTYERLDARYDGSMSGGAPPAPTTTYHDSIYIYRAPAIANDIVCLDGLGNAVACPTVDTIVARTWNTDSIPFGGVGRACWADGDTVRYFVSRSALAGGNLMDSLAYDTLNTIISQAQCDTAGVKSFPIPN